MNAPIFNRWPTAVLVIFLVLLLVWAVAVDWLGPKFGAGVGVGVALMWLANRWDREDAVNTLPEEGRD